MDTLIVYFRGLLSTATGLQTLNDDRLEPKAFWFCFAQVIISIDISQTMIIYLQTHFQVVYYMYNCVKFHQYEFTCLGGVTITRNMDVHTDRVIPILYGNHTPLPDTQISNFTQTLLTTSFVIKIWSMCNIQNTYLNREC